MLSPPVLKPEPRDARAPIALASRGVVVVDGSSGGFRALAWAAGYARARRPIELDVLLFPRVLNKFNDVHHAASLFSGVIADFDDLAARNEFEGTALQICRDNDLRPRIRHTNQGSWQDLANTICQERPDFVVLGRVEKLSWWAVKRAVSRLTKNDIPVTIVP